MLSEKTVSIVKATAPVLAEHGETLTRHFYKRMFTHNPEVAPFFNPANQAAGKQQKALAGAILAYAANVDNLGALTGAVELIAQKHASLLIKPEHYPIVGANLLASIREVLGAAATDDIVDAWAEAYGFLADILIAREKQIYEENARKDGGWEGFKPFRVVRKERESAIITSFYLAPADGAPLPLFKPGQYITVRVATPSGGTTMRNYSLSDQPGQDWFRISVKREVPPKADTPAGYTSNLLHDTIHVGDALEIAPPCGDFFLDTDAGAERPLVLVAGGVGVTPILSILLTALKAAPDRDITFVQGSLNENVHAFKHTVDGLAAQHPNLKVHYRYSDLPAPGIARSGTTGTGLIDTALIDSLTLPRDADYYFCGPQVFMASLYRTLLKRGVTAERLRFEFFGPRGELEKAA